MHEELRELAADAYHRRDLLLPQPRAVHRIFRGRAAAADPRAAGAQAQDIVRRMRHRRRALHAGDDAARAWRVGSRARFDSRPRRQPGGTREGAARALFGLGDARDAAGTAWRNISAAIGASLYSTKACGRWCASRNAISRSKTIHFWQPQSFRRNLLPQRDHVPVRPGGGRSDCALCPRARAGRISLSQPRRAAARNLAGISCRARPRRLLLRAAQRRAESPGAVRRSPREPSAMRRPPRPRPLVLAASVPLAVRDLADRSPHRARTGSPALDGSLPKGPSLSLGAALMKAERFDEALATLEALPPADRLDPDVLLLTAMIQVERGKLERGRPAMRLAARARRPQCGRALPDRALSRAGRPARRGDRQLPRRRLPRPGIRDAALAARPHVQARGRSAAARGASFRMPRCCWRRKIRPASCCSAAASAAAL